VNLQFRSELEPSASLIKRVATNDLTNPFCASEYVSATKVLGAQTCLISLWEADELVVGCFGFLFGRFLRRSLYIPSLPTIPNPKVFWAGLLDLCRKLKVWRLEINSYGSPASDVPQLPGELTRKTRWEYVLDLTSENMLDGVSSHHRRNINRAAQAGLRVQRTRTGSACTEHVQLMRTSLQRRAERGEVVNTDLGCERELALLASGCGEIFQAVSGERVLSSGLVLRSSMGAYYQSTGSSPDGLKLGSSPFLISQIASVLQQEGIRLFNLGGTSADSPGLRRFKAGFGAREVELQAATFCPKSVVERKVHNALSVGWAWIK
jgi:Acetyltransferase (GNAT) domain